MSRTVEDLEDLTKAAICAESIGREEGLALARHASLEELMYHANAVRDHHRGGTVSLCAIANARSGLCGEDCAFCSQSARWKTGVPTYPLRAADDIADAASRAGAAGADAFGIVTSGRAPDDEEFEGLVECARRARTRSRIEVHMSVGFLTPERVRALREAGVTGVNHNLETSERFFPKVCTTHSWSERARCIETALGEGMAVCSGGIFGLGETWEDRVDLALALRSLGVKRVPVNFLHPVAGTPLEGRKVLSADEALRILAVFRFLLPDAEIRTCGGRELVLGSHQSKMFAAGASATMLGDYLTTKGRPAAADLDMIEGLGFVTRASRLQGACGD
jgi:biotin synthase